MRRGTGEAVVRTVASGLGLVALGVAVVLGMLAAFGAFGSKAAQESAAVGLESTVETTNPQAENAAALDQTVTAGDVSWTVTAATEETELRTYTFPPKSVPGSYVTMDFTVENLSEEPVTLTGDTVTLLDASGIKYQPEPDRNSTFVRPELNILFNEHSLLEPGEKGEGRVNFEVLPRASGFVVLLGDTDPTTSEGEYVDLGF
jgi:hypothetical protein